MLVEIGKFLSFFLFLTIIASGISAFRSQDRQFLYADAGAKIEDSQFTLSSWLLEDYPRFLNQLFFEGGGETLAKENVWDAVSVRFLPTLSLSLFALFFGTISGVGLALFAVYLDNNFISNLYKFFSELILSTPIFVVGILLLYVFFFNLEWLPPGGYEPGNFSYLVLPGIALGSRIFARLYLYTVREARRESESNLSFVLKTRGFSRRFILFKSVFLKMLPVLIVFVLLDFGSLLSGAMVVEELFFFPGIGKALYYAIKSMDANLLGALLVYSGVVFYSLSRGGNRLRVWALGKEEESG